MANKQAMDVFAYFAKAVRGLNAYNIDSWSLYYKTLRSRNLRKIYIFRSKLASSGLNKHTSLSKLTHQLTMESLHYEYVMFLKYRPQVSAFYNVL